MAARSKSHIEKVENTSKDKAFWENHISEAIREFYYTEFGAETTEQIAKCSQNSFVSACEYARRACINKADLMEFTPHVIKSTGAVVHNEQYNSETIEILCNIYISLCFLYDKIPSVFGFALLTGIDRQTIEGWVAEVKNGSGVSLQYRLDRQKSVKNIKAARALSLQNVAVTGGKGTVGCLAVLNNEVWNETVPQEKIDRPLDVSELPIFDSSAGWIDKGVRNDAAMLPDFSKTEAVTVGELPHL